MVDGNAGEPLGLRVAPWVDGSQPGLRLAFNSRGDRVRARLLLPAAEAPDRGTRRGEGAPCLLLPLAARDADEARDLEEAARGWARDGLAVASLDLPLHGSRAGGKRPTRLDPWLPEIGRQALCDLGRCLEALAGLPEIDPQRLGYAGLGLGAWVGAAFWGADPRPRAAALAPWGAGFGPAAETALAALGGAAPRPLLVVTRTGDDADARRLLRAAPEPRRQLELRTSPDGREALAAMGDFLRSQLTRSIR